MIILLRWCHTCLLCLLYLYTSWQIEMQMQISWVNQVVPHLLALSGEVEGRGEAVAQTQVKMITLTMRIAMMITSIAMTRGSRCQRLDFQTIHNHMIRMIRMKMIRGRRDGGGSQWGGDPVVGTSNSRGGGKSSPHEEGDHINIIIRVAECHGSRGYIRVKK